MADVYLSLGSNKGNRKFFISKALKKLKTFGTIDAISNIYETEPWGFYAEKNFYNIAILYKTKLNPIDLLSIAKQIEYALGRQKYIDKKYSSREIDIDIIFYNNLIVKHPFLHIPHKLAHKRKFVLYPMAELNPHFVHPVLNKTIVQLIALCDDNSYIKKITDIKLSLS